MIEIPYNIWRVWWSYLSLDRKTLEKYSKGIKSEISVITTTGLISIFIILNYFLIVYQTGPSSDYERFNKDIFIEQFSTIISYIIPVVIFYWIIRNNIFNTLYFEYRIELLSNEFDIYRMCFLNIYAD